MEDLYPLVHDDGDVVYFAVDSVVANEDEALHFASGEVGKPQREKLKPLLCEHKGKTRVSFFHHHPGKSTEPNRRRSFQFREARIGPDTHEVSMISFRPF